MRTESSMFDFHYYYISFNQVIHMIGLIDVLPQISEHLIN